MRLTTTGSPGGRDTPSHIWAKRIPVGAMHRPPSCSALATSKLRLSAQRNCRFRLTREPALRFTRANRPTTGGQRASALLTHSSCPIQSTFTEPSLPPSWREQLPERHASSVPGGRLSKHERTLIPEKHGIAWTIQSRQKSQARHHKKSIGRSHK